MNTFQPQYSNTSLPSIGSAPIYQGQMQQMPQGQMMQQIPSPMHQSGQTSQIPNLSTLKNILKKVGDAIKNKKYLGIDTSSRKSNNKAETFLQLGGARNKWKKHPDWIYERYYRLVGTVPQVKYVLASAFHLDSQKIDEAIAQAYTVHNYDTTLKEQFQKEIDDQSKIKEQGKITLNSLSYLSEKLASGEYYYGHHDRYVLGKYEHVYVPSVTTSSKRSRKTLVDKINEAIKDNLIRKDGNNNIYNLIKVVDISKSDTGSIVKVSLSSSKYTVNPNRPDVPIATNSLERYRNALDEFYKADLQDPSRASVVRASIEELVGQMSGYLRDWMSRNGYSGEGGQVVPQQLPSMPQMGQVQQVPTSLMPPTQFSNMPGATVKQEPQAGGFGQQQQQQAQFPQQQQASPVKTQFTPPQQQQPSPIQSMFTIPGGSTVQGLASSPVSNSPTTFGTTPYQG